MRSLPASVFLCLVAASQASFANDSSASLDLGGLQFLYQPDVRMLEEELFISLSQVRVRYVFENTSDEDVVTTVAFPLPPVETGEGGNYSIESNDPLNFIEFAVSQDGKPIAFQTQVRAHSNGVDITEMLKRYELPMTTMMPTDDHRKFHDRLNAMPPEARAELSISGAVSYWADRSVNPPRWDGDAQWKTSIVFYWPQTFPAHTKIELVQSYHPVPRRTFTSSSDIRDPATRKKFCINKAFENALDAKAKHWGETLSRTDLDYVLTTGNNWSGSIGSFSLTIEKPSPDALLSTCLRGLKPDGEGRFTLKIKDFEPSDDLRLFFASKLE